MSAVASDPSSVLASVPLFADLSQEELHALARRTLTRHARGGELLFQEGEACEGLYVIESGSVKIFKTAPSGREQMLTIDGPGQSIAEVPVFDGGPYPASAMAVVDSRLLFVSKREFRGLMLEHPEIALKVIRAIGMRLRRLVALIEELSFTTVRARLVNYLVRSAHSEGQHTERGTEFVLAANQEIASQVGTVRELISRNLSRLQAEGLIRMDGKRVIVPDVEALSEAGGGDA